ncbi:NAD-dependent epimerase/dehydratase family protein [Sulfitobacter sp. CB2047]|uniref:UDP-2-acetamido-2,6-beta-L-arabino-hexul-4-ose reductase n=1 Tax=Sulfitobacter sp. CB2047 TaxID=1525218 RepID=UPI0004E38829|nr:NAD-dependent epimerase/dehydratase family protein [Sulfitobacter sp. CB2047]ULO22240.1 NAD-dependent epimerase/dehydratase family protein [Sulfitobacter sp. CB2047]
MQVLITGAAGFIGRNLALRLTEAGHTVLPATRNTTNKELVDMVARADVVVHLAGANRPETDAEFDTVNDQYTARLCTLLRDRSAPVPVIAASTIQIERETPYGRSKRTGENHLRALGAATGAAVNICRLVNVFGKWCRPNYNSVVATFCHNIARDLPITISDPLAEIRLVHVDDVVDNWLTWLSAPVPGVQVTSVEPEYRITLQDLADRLRGFRAVRDTHTVGETSTGLGRALYATYVSYLPVEAFAYPVTRHGDERGVFAEMLRTEQSGQFSFFTAGPGITRGGHYHHAKTEKFLVLKGTARFRFLNIDTGETHSIDTTGDESLIVETVPGWSHDITNIGENELICMLWANELFDRERPDTIAHPLNQ